MKSHAITLLYFYNLVLNMLWPIIMFVPKNNNIYNLNLNFLFLEMQNKNDIQYINHIKYIFCQNDKNERKRKTLCIKWRRINYLVLRNYSLRFTFQILYGNQTNVKVESYTTIGDLKCDLMNRLDFNIQRVIYYSIYAISEKKFGTEERFIDDREKVCDILSVWNNEKRDKKTWDTSKFLFYLKLLIYYPFEKDVFDTLSIVYYQTVYDVISGKHPVDERKIISLAAYQLVIEFEYDEDVAEKKINDSLNKLIPANKFNLMTAEDWKEKS